MSENVKVVVRCRPLSNNETNQNFDNIIEIDENKSVISILLKSSKIFTFDHVFGVNSKQDQIFIVVALPLIESVINGYNGTILAYGQTGAGKTHTMEGSDADLGIIPRSFDHIFDMIAKYNVDTNFLVRISYIEIYNEEVRDLLGKDQNKKLDVVERPDIGVYIKNLSTYIAKNSEDMISLYKLGNKTRVIASTDMNEHSSRSHSIFTITIEQSHSIKPSPIYDEDSPDDIINSRNSAIVKMGKLHLVDLAGSERIDKSRAFAHGGDMRIKEASKINYSLSCLGNVVSSLIATEDKSIAQDKISTSPHRSQRHIPYRNSKLTHILKDSLGGNSKTVMIANIGPADYNAEETLSTLRYAHRVKSIKNTAIINEDPKDAMIRKFQDEIEELKRLLKESDQVCPTESNEITNDASPENEVDSAAYSKTRTKAALSPSKIKEIQRDIDREKKVLAERKDLLGEEKNVVFQKLQEREKELINARLERDALTQKLMLLEKKIVMGGKNKIDLLESTAPELFNENLDLPNEFDMVNNMYDMHNFDFAQIEAQLKQSERELEDRLKRRKAIAEAIQETHAARINMEERYGSLKEEAKAKTEKLKTLWEQILDAKSQLTDLKREHQVRKDAAIDTIRSLTREYKLYTAIVDSFVPKTSSLSNIPMNTSTDDKIIQELIKMPKNDDKSSKKRYGYLDLIRDNSEWDGNKQEWKLKCIAYSGNNMLPMSEEINFDELDNNKELGIDRIPQETKDKVRELFYGDQRKKLNSEDSDSGEENDIYITEDHLKDVEDFAKHSKKRSRRINGLKYPKEIYQLMDFSTT